jgi:hypothetical protein
MKNASMNELHESPDERMLKRRARRWKRRARIAGPLLSVPILVLTLALSVDLIEYQPQEPQEKLADRPIPESILAKQHSRAIPHRTTVSEASVAPPPSSLSAEGTQGLPTGTSGIDLSLNATDATVDAQSPGDFAPPTPPYALKGRR